MPERFLKDGRLNPDVRDPATIAFGYGRRYVFTLYRCHNFHDEHFTPIQHLSWTALRKCVPLHGCDYRSTHDDHLGAGRG